MKLTVAVGVWLLMMVAACWVGGSRKELNPQYHTDYEQHHYIPTKNYPIPP